MADALEIVYVGVPPEGVVPNHDNPAYIGYRIIIANVICLGFSTIVMILRIYTRGWIVRAIGIDDWSMIASWILCLTLGILTMIMTKFGLGMHMWEIPFTLFSPRFTLLNIIAAVIYAPCVMFTKASILWLYLRLSPAKSFRAFVYATMALAFCYSMASFWALIFSCTPTKAGWDLSITNAKCIDRNALYFSVNGFNIFTDILILVLPIRLVLGLQIPQRQKFGLLGIFMCGGFVCIVAIIRLYSLVGLSKSSDLSWETTNALIWCVIEANVGIICGSIATLKPFLKVHCPVMLGGSSDLSGRYSKSRSKTASSYALKSGKGIRLADNAGFKVNSSQCNATESRTNHKVGKQFHSGVSEESIISDEERDGKIHKRTEVVVEYHNSSTASLTDRKKSEDHMSF